MISSGTRLPSFGEFFTLAMGRELCGVQPRRSAAGENASRPVTALPRLLELVDLAAFHRRFPPLCVKPVEGIIELVAILPGGHVVASCEAHPGYASARGTMIARRVRSTGYFN